MKIYSRYDFPPKVKFHSSDVSRAMPSYYPQTTIKYLIDRFKRTGIFTDPDLVAKARYLDVSSVPSFGDAQTKLALAKGLFESLSDYDRSRYNSFSEWLDFLTDTANADDDLFKEAHSRMTGELFEHVSEAKEAEAKLAELRPDSAPVVDLGGVKSADSASVGGSVSDRGSAQSSSAV